MMSFVINRIKKKDFFFSAITRYFSHKDHESVLKSKRCIQIYIFADREYSYKFSGRCISFRSRGKISSLVLRNFSYGIEQRFFTNNPRLVAYF